MSRLLVRRWLAAAWLVVAGMSSVVCAEETPQPPFWVAGVVIASSQRSAVLVVLDEARRDVGLVRLREGESYGGYRVAGVEPAVVRLERNGVVFSVPVGRPGTPAEDEAAAGSQGARTPIFIPGPSKPTPDLEYNGPQMERRQQGSGSSALTGSVPADPEEIRDLLQRVFSDPQLQRKIEELRPLIRERLERAKQDRQEPADAARRP